MARAVLRFIAGVVLFIHRHQAQIGQAGKNSQARAQHDAGAAAVRGQPRARALGQRHAAVHADHGLCAQMRKALAELRQKLRG